MILDQHGELTKRQKTNETDDFHEIFADSKFYKEVLNLNSEQMTDEEYVDWHIKVAKQFFNLDRGASDAKKINLGDIKSTRIDFPHILSYALFDPAISDEAQKKKQPI